jgi:succinate-semialdehyde dehydrogenase / glutarate-semialdehyde dehydrogenase
MLENSELLQTKLFINNQFIHATGHQTFSVINPATGDILVKVDNASITDTECAILAAHQALENWKATPAKERSEHLRTWFNLIKNHQTELAHIVTLEQGKPLQEAIGEIHYGASFVEWFAEQAKRIEGSILSSPQTNKELLVFQEPIGVCAAITPWNFPMAMITRKAAPALAAGCTIVIKPAEQTPLTALALAKLAQMAGIPPGVINIVTADQTQSIAVGKILCESPLVKKLSFTGSTQVGRELLKQCASTIKRCSMELGGHAPFIVFADADLDAAIAAAVSSKYRNAGQTCICSNRFYVHQSIADRFAQGLAEKAYQLKVGNGLDPINDLGPLIDQIAINKVQSHVQDAINQGAQLLTGGQAHNAGPLFFQPTVLHKVKESMLICQQETFGPVAAVLSFENEAEVIAKANHPEYGLAAYFFSRDLAQIFRVAKALEYGMIGVNTGLISNEIAPFGGLKQSGFGREGSRWGIEEYLETKYLCLGGM